MDSLCESKGNTIKFDPLVSRYTEQFHCLLNDPSRLTNNNLLEALRVLCRINAHRTLQRFFKKHWDYFNAHTELGNNLPVLLRDAISSLQPQAVEVLMKLHDDRNKYVVSTHDSDERVSHFCSPLFFALNLR